MRDYRISTKALARGWANFLVDNSHHYVRGYIRKASLHDAFESFLSYLPVDGAGLKIPTVAKSPVPDTQGELHSYEAASLVAISLLHCCPREVAWFLTSEEERFRLFTISVRDDLKLWVDIEKDERDES